ncbi:MAG TPA: hypothetical protein DDZ05_01065 [Candidatus Blackburnbacteria bacterium]|nr:hypothetical protein [Candidatus Blackburnbacteria bacterium]
MPGIQYKLSWDEYGQLTADLWNNLEKKLQELNLKIDAIIVILREGVFTGIPLAYKLNTYKVIPIQFKYMLYEGRNEQKQITKIPEILYKLPDKPTFLLCDTFPAGGNTKKLAIEEFKKVYPNSKFVMSSLIEDKSADKLPDIILRVHAVDVDNEYNTNHPIYKRAGVTNVLYTLLPWENEQEELAGPDYKEWNYN